MTHSKNIIRCLILPLLSMTILIDAIGAGLVFPLLSALFMQGKNSLFSADASLPLRYLSYGLSFSAWPLGAFFGSSYLVRLSDSRSRKNILVLSLFINGLVYLVSSGAIFIGSVWMFLVSRFLSGISGGCYSVAQAAALDLITPDAKNTGRGMIPMLFIAGTIIGSMLSGITSIETYSQWFSFETPFIIFAGLSVVNSILVLLLFHERTPASQKTNPDLSFTSPSFTFIFKNRHISGLGTIFLLLNIGWGLFLSSIPVVLSNVFDLKADYTGLYFCIMGVGSFLSLIFLKPFLIHRLIIKKSCITLSCIASILMLAAYLFTDIKILAAIGFVFGMVEILIYTSCLTLLTDSVPDTMQSNLASGAVSLCCLAFAISGGLMPLMSYISCLLPILFAGLLYIFSVFLMLGRIHVKKFNNEMT